MRDRWLAGAIAAAIGFFGGCGEDATPTTPTAIEPEVDETRTDEAPPTADVPTIEPEASPIEAPVEAATETPAEPREVVLQPNATVTTDPAHGVTYSVVYRLAAAIGLPRPTLHGPPTRATDTRHVALVSFTNAAAAGTEEWTWGELHPEIWLIEQRADGETRRLGALPIEHVPMTDYLALSVGEVAEQAHELFHVRVARSGDLDADQRAEFEVVVELSDDVVCGEGLLTHRYYMIYNVEPTLQLAADVVITRTNQSGFHDRGTTRLVDHNGDGHPDIHLRTRTCTEYEDDDPEGRCRGETVEDTYYVWDAATDRWTREASAEAPCDGSSE